MARSSYSRYSKVSNARLAVLFGAIAVAVGINGPWMTDQDGASKTLQNAGFEPVLVEGFSFLGCGKGDLWRTKFVAKNQQGNDVEGVVCKGIFKGSTIRFD